MGSFIPQDRDRLGAKITGIDYAGKDAMGTQIPNNETIVNLSWITVYSDSLTLSKYFGGILRRTVGSTQYVCMRGTNVANQVKAVTCPHPNRARKNYRNISLYYSMCYGIQGSHDQS